MLFYEILSYNVLFTNFRKNSLFVIFTNFVNPALFSLFRHFLRFNPPARSSDPTDFESAQCPVCSHVYTAPSFAHSDALAVPEYSEDQSHSPASGSQRNALANGILTCLRMPASASAFSNTFCAERSVRWRPSLCPGNSQSAGCSPLYTARPPQKPLRIAAFVDPSCPFPDKLSVLSVHGRVFKTQPHHFAYPQPGCIRQVQNSLMLWIFHYFQQTHDLIQGQHIR